MTENEVKALQRIQAILMVDLQTNPIPDRKSQPVMAPLIDYKTGIIRMGISHPLELRVTIGYMTIGHLKAIMGHVLQVEAAAAGAPAAVMNVAPKFGAPEGGMA